MAGKLLFLHGRPATPRAARRAGDDYGATAEPDWRTVDWRAHLREVEVAGRRMNLVDVGEGEREPLLFIHGLNGEWQNWLENIPYFAQQRRVIAPDLPGFGRSEMPRERISISGFADALDELLERLEVERAVVVGNSMGGFAGAEMAIRHPARVERLCLVSAAGIAINDLRRQPLLTLAKLSAWLAAHSAAERERILRRPGYRHLVFSWVFRHPTRLAPDLLWEQIQGTDAPGFVDALDALTSYDFVDRLPEVSCPTLVVWGRNDALVPVRDAYEFERLIPDARAVVLDETGHCAMLERPRTFNELVERFLDEAGRADEQSGARLAAERELATSP
jgi:pimeloyl-ACP methyl ester carboxylesterase